MIEHAELLGAIAGFLQLAAAIVIALTVHRLTQRLGTIEHRREIDSAWQNFNSLIIQSHGLRKYFVNKHEFESEEQVEAAFLMFMQMNLIYEAWHGIKDGFPLQDFAGNMVEDHIRIMSLRDPNTLALCLDGRGYSDNFVDYVEKRAKRANAAFMTRQERHVQTKQQEVLAKCQAA
jgi:hypothetical protein